jgi:hypothetical protein
MGHLAEVVKKGFEAANRGDMDAFPHLNSPTDGSSTAEKL